MSGEHPSRKDKQDDSMTEVDAIKRCTDGPVTFDSLCADLRALGVQSGMTMLVHSSMSALGWMPGGALTAVLALQEVLGEQGTLVMPTQSGDFSDPAHWQHPPVPESWWETIRQTMPVYDPDMTPTRKMGKIVDCFRSQRDTLRSSHPQLSFAARGPLAEQITANHALEYGLGENSPLARLYEQDAWVLLMGVKHGNNTSLHLAESRSKNAGSKTTQAQAPLLVDGQRQWVTFTDVDYDDEDFAKIGEEFEAQADQLRVAKIGYGEGRLFRQRLLVDYAVKWIEEHRS
jgi:aminoglycoside 3-N-acetyltransferase